MSTDLQSILNRVCRGYLNSWWSIQPRSGGDWSEYPVEAQASHLLAQALPVVDAARPSPRKHFPVCESAYWSPGIRKVGQRESKVYYRADVWAPDFHAPPAAAGWFFELKLAHLDGDASTIGGEWWAKIVSGFMTDIQRLLVFSAPDSETSAQYGFYDAVVRCSFVIVFKGAKSAFGTRPFLPADRDTEWERELGALKTAAQVTSRIRDDLDRGDVGQPGRERARGFLDAARGALRRTKGVTEVELVASEGTDHGDHRVQVVAISWLQAAPVKDQ